MKTTEQANGEPKVVLAICLSIVKVGELIIDPCRQQLKGTVEPQGEAAAGHQIERVRASSDGIV